MELSDMSAEIITRPGALGDVSYPALEIHVKGFASPYVLTLALPAVVHRALSEQVDPLVFYEAIADAVNAAQEVAEATDASVRRTLELHADEARRC